MPEMQINLHWWKEGEGAISDYCKNDLKISLRPSLNSPPGDTRGGRHQPRHVLRAHELVAEAEGGRDGGQLARVRLRLAHAVILVPCDWASDEYWQLQYPTIYLSLSQSNADFVKLRDTSSTNITSSRLCILILICQIYSNFNDEFESSTSFLKSLSLKHLKRKSLDG